MAKMGNLLKNIIETECISYVHQDQVYTHMIDVISEYIKNSVQNVDKRE